MTCGTLRIEAPGVRMSSARFVVLDGGAMAMAVKHWQDPVSIVFGGRMLISPWALRYRAEPNATWNGAIVGL